MQNRYQYYVYLFIGIFTLSCHNELTYNELVSYLINKDNELCIEKQVNRISYTLTYWPSDMLVYNQLNVNEVYNEREVVELRKLYGSKIYFKLKVTNSGSDLLSEYDMQSPLSFNLPFKINAITNLKDTIPITDFHYSRMFEFQMKTEALLVFNKETLSNEEKWIKIELDDTRNVSGIISFKFFIDQLNSVPQLIMGNEM